MAIVKSKLLKQLSNNYPGFLKKDLEKFSNIIFDEIKKALKRGDGVELRNFGTFRVKIKKLLSEETLKLVKKYIHQKREQFTSKWLKTCLIN